MADCPDVVGGDAGDGLEHVVLLAERWGENGREGCPVPVLGERGELVRIGMVGCSTHRPDVVRGDRADPVEEGTCRVPA